MDIYTFEDMVSAVQNAQPGEALWFDIKNDTLFTSAVLVNKTLRISLTNGSGNESVTLMVTVGGAFRHFTTGPVSVNGVSIAVGAGIVFSGGETGGGLHMFGSNCLLALEGCAIAGCRSSGNGGGVLVQGNANRSRIMMHDVLIRNCQAVSGGGVFGSACEIEMTGGEITGNRTASSGGGIATVAGANTLGSVITINGGSIRNNSVSSGDGGGITAHDTVVTIDGCEVSYNTADGSGGGIYSLNQTGNGALNALSIRNSVITGNTIRNFGGGIRVENAFREFTITNCMITGNKAVSALAGSKQGGGIYLSGASLTVRDTKVSANEAGASGGGIFANRSTLIVGGTAEISENEAAITAGGIYGYQGCTIVIEDNAKVTDNRAYSGDDPENTARGGGGIALLSYGFVSTLTVKGNALIGGNTSVSYGGGIWTYPVFGPETVVNIEGGTIQGNAANYGGGISMGEIPGYTPILTVTGGKITGNTALTDGGGIIAKGSAVTVSGGEITGNSAGRDGGGIYTDRIENVTVYADAAFGENIAASYVYWQVTSGGDSDIHKEHILTDRFSAFVPVQTPPPEAWLFTNAYNNYDINYSGQPAQTVTVNFAEADNPSRVLHTAVLDSFTGATVMIPPRDTFTDIDGTVWALHPSGQSAQFVRLTDPEAQYVVTFYHEETRSNVTVTEYYVDLCGYQIMQPTQTIVSFGGDYRRSVPGIMGFAFVGYKINGEPLQTGEVYITGINADAAVTFVYAWNGLRPCRCCGSDPCAKHERPRVCGLPFKDSGLPGVLLTSPASPRR